MAILETKQITINGRRLIVNADDARVKLCDSLKQVKPKQIKRKQIKKEG